MQSSKLVAVGLALVLAACGSDSTGPNGNGSTPTFESIAGTYTGFVAGTDQGITIDGILSVTITQSSGNLSGAWTITGTETPCGGDICAPTQGTGSLTGTINSGQNPSVNITFASGITEPLGGLCPDHQAVFSGAYDGTNHQLTLSGPIDILDASCNVVRSYQNTIILSR